MNDVILNHDNNLIQPIQVCCDGLYIDLTETLCFIDVRSVKQGRMLSSSLLCCSLLSSAVSAGWFSNCGQLSSTCTTSSSLHTADYLGLSAADKAARILEKVLEDTTSADWFSSPLQIAGLLAERMCPTFT